MPVSTVKTVVQTVENLDEARKIYELGLGLICVGEAKISAAETVEARGGEGGDFRVARFARRGEDFGCVDLVENPNAVQKIRDQNRVFDYGVMTLNFRTNDIEKAVPELQKCGCETVSEILEYDAGKPMREVMLNTPAGERLTILEVGGANYDLPIFNEAVATVGLIVPSMTEAKQFYEEGLGLKTAIAFQASGAPFDSLLGVKKLDRLDFATLTSNGNWTGKIELLELETGESPVFTGDRADLSHTGYTFVTFLTENLNAAAESCRRFNAEIIVEPKLCDRPFHKGKRAMIVRAPGGERLEFIEN